MTDFERFFATEFKKRLDEIGDEAGALSSGQPLKEASWDRRSAWLLWDVLGRPVCEPPPIAVAPLSVGLNAPANEIFKDLLG